MQYQILAACDSAAAAAEVIEGGGKDLPHQLAAESMLAAASSLLSASLPFLHVPASHLGVDGNRGTICRIKWKTRA